MARHLLLMCCCAVVALTARRPETWKRDARLLLPRWELLYGLGQSHLQLVTDYYWLMAINRSTVILTEEEGLAMVRLGELITNLDPRFRQAYILVGVNAPVPPEVRGEVWPNSREAAALLRKGIALYPLENRLYILLGYNYMGYQHDFVSAAEVLMLRSAFPDALPYFGQLATRLLAVSGRYEVSREFARVMIASAPDDETRKVYEERLKLIDLEEQLAAVESAAQRYNAEHPEPAKTVGDLLSAGYLSQEPRDPFGGVIVIDAKGRARSTASERLEVHE